MYRAASPSNRRVWGERRGYTTHTTGPSPSHLGETVKRCPVQVGVGCPLVHHACLDDVHRVGGYCCTEACHCTGPAEEPATPIRPHPNHTPRGMSTHTKCAGRASCMALRWRRWCLQRSYAGRITPATTVARCMVGPTPYASREHRRLTSLGSPHVLGSAGLTRYRPRTPSSR